VARLAAHSPEIRVRGELAAGGEAAGTVEGRRVAAQAVCLSSLLLLLESATGVSVRRGGPGLELRFVAALAGVAPDVLGVGRQQVTAASAGSFVTCAFSAWEMLGRKVA
jgi:hypothetical protein